MSEIVNSVSPPKIQSRRCLVCRLPAELREEVERDRIRHRKTFDSLAQELGSKGFPLSPASLRRHFRHVAPDSQFEARKTDNGNSEPAPTPFDPLLTGDYFSEKQVAETLVRSVLLRLQDLERQERAVQDQPSRERLAARYLKTLAALERSLKRLEEVRKPERDVKKIVAEALQRASVAIRETYKAGMEEQIGALKQGVYDFLDHKVRPEEFLRQISRWQEEWPTSMATRIAETLIITFRAAGRQA